MNKELYYCKQWKHIFCSGYEMCVSEIIYSNNKKMAQIHIIVMKEGMVVRGVSKSSLKGFEKGIRELIINRFNTDNGMPEEMPIKIWYYNIDDSGVDPNDIPLRIAVTFNNPSVNIEDYSKIREEIYAHLKDLVDKCNINK